MSPSMARQIRPVTQTPTHLDTAPHHTAPPPAPHCGTLASSSLSSEPLHILSPRLTCSSRCRTATPALSSHSLLPGCLQFILRSPIRQHSRQDRSLTPQAPDYMPCTVLQTHVGHRHYHCLLACLSPPIDHQLQDGKDCVHCPVQCLAHSRYTVGMQ